MKEDFCKSTVQFIFKFLAMKTYQILAFLLLNFIILCDFNVLAQKKVLKRRRKIVPSSLIKSYQNDDETSVVTRHDRNGRCK